MTQNLFKTIWKDTVWSAVIASIIFAIIGYIWNYGFTHRLIPREPDNNTNKTYDVTLVLPSIMQGAKILVDNESPKIIKNSSTYIVIRINKKESNHLIVVKKGDQYCSEQVFINDQTKRLQPCKEITKI